MLPFRGLAVSASIHISSLSLAPPVETVLTKRHVAPRSVDRYVCTFTAPARSMPSVAAHAVPSGAQATAGSEWNAAPSFKGSSVLFQPLPPSEEKNTLSRPEPVMLLEAAIT